MADPTKVLLVDDDESLFVVYEKLFENAFGDTVVLNHCPQDRMLGDMLSKDRYAVVILDQMLQNGTTGLDLVPTIRTSGNDIRILMNSGYGSEKLAAKSIDAGVDAYVLGHKEDTAQLVSEVRKAIDEHDRVETIRSDILSNGRSPLHRRCERLRREVKTKIATSRKG